MKLSETIRELFAMRIICPLRIARLSGRINGLLPMAIIYPLRISRFICDTVGNDQWIQQKKCSTTTLSLPGSQFSIYLLTTIPEADRPEDCSSMTQKEILALKAEIERKDSELKAAEVREAEVTRQKNAFRDESNARRKEIRELKFAPPPPPIIEYVDDAGVVKKELEERLKAERIKREDAEIALKLAKDTVRRELVEGGEEAIAELQRRETMAASKLERIKREVAHLEGKLTSEEYHEKYVLQDFDHFMFVMHCAVDALKDDSYRTMNESQVNRYKQLAFIMQGTAETVMTELRRLGYLERGLTDGSH